ncbi:unnamed protein product [Mytilus coruscus]|uniref:Integrase core domain-containing protein n=1 Tax=Mytilus coruscus TaxID=42192 RepID=A0A6J8CKU9_MYTCO|nr:unnamed protein product [Mytilus coruscus]
MDNPVFPQEMIDATIEDLETVRFALNALDTSSVVRRLNRRLTRRRYCNKGPNFCIHIVGYDKLKPYGISIHGAIDGFSWKILWLSASHSNKNPRIVAFDYVHYLKTIKGVPRMVLADAGTENVDIKYIQMALRSFHNDDVAGCRSFTVGKSSANQRIEMLWSFLMPHFTVFWRNFFKDMIDAGELDNTDRTHMECVRFCFLPIIQRHLDTFRITWNSHRIRNQRSIDVTGNYGIPDVMYHNHLSVMLLTGHMKFQPILEY